MKIKELLDCLGEPETSEKLKKILHEIDVDLSSELVLSEGEYRAYIERPSEGYSLVFTDEAIFLGKENQAIGNGELYLSGVFLYAKDKDGYSQFNQALPMSLSFSAKKADLHEKLGMPSWDRKRIDGSVAAERWDEVADYRIHITYSKISEEPVLISLNKADKK